MRYLLPIIFFTLFTLALTAWFIKTVIETSSYSEQSSISFFNSGVA